MLPRRLRRLPQHTRPGGLTVHEARGFRARLLGLSLMRKPPPGHALLIPRCRCVHTFGMRFALDLVWLDSDGATLQREGAVPPNRLRRCPTAAAVLELPARTHEPPQPHAER